MNEEKEILDTIYKYYPKNVDRYNPEYDTSGEHIALMYKLKTAAGDLRWNDFLSQLQTIQNLDIFDCSTFAFPIPCFKVNIYINNEIGKHEIVFFISIIADYYALTYTRLYNDPYWDDNWDENSKQIAFEQFSAGYARHKEEYKPSLNSYPESVAKLIETVITFQEKSFNYKLLPQNLANKFVPDVATNGKLLGAASIFDCIFTELEI